MLAGSMVRNMCCLTQGCLAKTLEELELGPAPFWMFWENSQTVAYAVCGNVIHQSLIIQLDRIKAIPYNDLKAKLSKTCVGQLVNNLIVAMF